MNDRVLITGSTGFVGRALAKALVKDGDFVVSMVRDRTLTPVGGAVVYGDVRDQAFCQRVIADYEINSIYHLAAQSIVSVCAEDPISALDCGIMGTATLLQAVREAGRPIRVVVSTSDKVYGSAPPPYDESTPLEARHAYEVSKACQDLVSRMFFHNYDVDVVVVRAVNIYGPGDPNGSRLVPRTITRILAGESPLLHQSAATMRRQYVYIDDLVNALRVVERLGKAGEAYCVGALGPPLSVLDVMKEISRQTGRHWTPPEIRDREARFVEIADQFIDDSKLRALGWEPVVGFEEGIAMTVKAALASAGCKENLG